MTNYTPGGTKPRHGTIEITVTTTRPSGVTSTRSSRVWDSRKALAFDPRYHSAAAERFANEKPCWMGGSK